MSSWNQFIQSTFAACRARNTKPWAGRHPMAWAAEVYALVKEQAEEQLAAHMPQEVIVATAPSPEETMLAMEMSNDIEELVAEPLYRPQVSLSFCIPRPAWERDPAFFMIRKTRQRLSTRAA